MVRCGDMSVGGGVLKGGGLLELGVLLVGGGILQCHSMVKDEVWCVTFRQQLVIDHLSTFR